FYRSSNSSVYGGKFTVDNCYVKSITSTSVAKGIHISFNNSSKADLLINNCHVEDITPATDGDAIHILSGNYTSSDIADRDYGATISNCFIKSAVPMKRAIKIQYHNARVMSNTVIGDNTLIGFDTYADNTIFNGNSYVEVVSGGEAYNLHYKKGQVISNATIVMNSSPAQAIRLDAAIEAKLSNIDIQYKGTASANELGMIYLQNDSNATAVNINIKADVSEGSGIALTGASSIVLSNSVLEGMKFGIYSNYGSGFVKVSNTKILNVLLGTHILGTGGLVFDLDGVVIEANDTGLYNKSTNNYATTLLKNSTITTANHGLLGGGADRVFNNTFIGTNSAGSIGLQGGRDGGWTALGNIVTGFEIGYRINYDSSTTAVMAHNQAITCTTPFSKIDSTLLLDVNNMSR
ncbi:MAG: hypothetical protein U9O94_10530, partial [Nanoarchaeota archaeon]|nr:hypothetical protein [Nanoarchaeota archaeon]